MSGAPERPKSWISTAYRVAVVAAAAAIVACAFLFYQAVTVSLEAERTLHANDFVLDVLTAHLNNSGTWPKSWGELTDSSPEQSGGMYYWPDDLQELQKRVYIDFALTLADVAAMEPNTFSAVTPIGPHYQASEAPIDNLLQVARRKNAPISNSPLIQADIEAAAIAEAAKRMSVEPEQLTAEAKKDGDDWDVLVIRRPETPGGHSSLLISKTGEVKKYFGGK